MMSKAVIVMSNVYAPRLMSYLTNLSDTERVII